MHISRAQSLLITIALLIAFFGASWWFTQSESGRQIDLTQVAEMAPATPSAPPLDERAPAESAVATSTPVPAAEISALLANASQDGSKFMLKDFHRSETRGGRSVWEITGSQGRYYPETNSAKVLDAKLTLHRKHNQEIVLTADQITISLQGTGLERADAEGHVVITHDKTTVLTTDHLEYESATGRVTAPGRVTIVGERIDLSGEGLEGELDTKRFTLLRDVSTTLKPPPSS